MVITVLQGQSLFDVAIEHCGSFEAVFSFALLNDLSLTEKRNAGESLESPAIENYTVVNYYTINNRHPATQVTEKRSGIFNRVFTHPPFA